jgi:hypothetical protein
MKRAWLITLLLARNISGAEITSANATNAIVGEAAGCPYVVKLGIADAIRNRGTLHGVYGFRARHNQFESQTVWGDSARAWAESRWHHTVFGATHFGSAADVAKGTFLGMKLTCILGAGKSTTYFYKP